MRPIINFFTGLTLGAGIMTAVVTILDAEMLIGPFFGVTVALIAITLGAKYIDWKMRNELIRLISSAEGRVSHEDYMRILDLKYEIRNGLSLAAAAEKLGELSHEMDFNVEIESTHI